MSKKDFDILFDRLESLAVGFGPVFRDFRLDSPNYPPHNIVKVSDSEFYIELAVAGFKKHEIAIQEHQGLLTVSGNKDSAEAREYQFRGLAARTFTKSFRIAEYFETADASIEDGILTIRCVKNAPDEAKPKLIAIR
jgi:molecular chaperone IbpA